MEKTRETRSRAPRGEGGLLRGRLLNAALAILDDGHEPADISIRGVTKRAGVSPTAFYLHFADRDELMAALVERVFTDFREWISAGAARGSSPQERLLTGSTAYLAFSRELPERYRLIFAAELDSEATADEPGRMPEVSSAAFEDLIDLISGYIGGGSPPSNAETLAIGIWSGLHGYASLCHSRPNMVDLSDEQALTDTKYVALLASAWLGPPPVQQAGLRETDAGANQPGP